MAKGKQKKYNTKHSFEWYYGIVFGIGFRNWQPKKKYNYSDWNISILLPFMVYTFQISYAYKKQDVAKSFETI